MKKEDAVLDWPHDSLAWCNLQIFKNSLKAGTWIVYDKRVEFALIDEAE